MPHASDCDCILLAAGLSSRMKGMKMLREIDGQRIRAQQDALFHRVEQQAPGGIPDPFKAGTVVVPQSCAVSAVQWNFRKNARGLTIKRHRHVSILPKTWGARTPI